MQEYSLKTVTASTLLAVTLAELYEHVYRDDTSAQTGDLTAAIQAATRYAETYQRRALLRETYRMQMDCFPEWDMWLPISGTLESTNVAIGYVDTDGSTQTMASTDYLVQTDAEPPRIQPSYGNVWPTARAQAGAVTVTFSIGSTSTTDIHQSTRQAIKQLAAHYDAQREGVIVGGITNVVPFGVNSLLDVDKVGSY